MQETVKHPPSSRTADALDRLVLGVEPASVQRRFVTVGDRQLHYRRAGSGPPVVLLHAPPMSSRALLPLIERLAGSFAAVAFDLPGYGNSDPPACIRPDIADYAESLLAAIDALAIERFGLYGAQVGALIAVELASRVPDRVTALVVDGIPLWTAEERAELATMALPDYVPEFDGSHLLRIWMRHRDGYVFAPWYRRELTARRLVDVPEPEALHEEFVDLLRAGEGYGAALAAAFRVADAERRLCAVTAPLAVLAREGDEFASHAGRLVGAAAELTTAASGESGHIDAIPRLLAEHPGDPTLGPAPISGHIPGRVTRDYADTRFGQILLRRAGWQIEGVVPLVMFHGGYSSGAWYEPLGRLMARHRPVVIVDTLGNGESDKNTFRDASAEDYARVVAEVIGTLDCGQVHLFGSHGGAVMAVETTILMAGVVGRVILDGLPMFTPEMIAERLTEYLEPFVARSDGGHLPWAWSYVRDAGLFWPSTRRKRDAIRLADMLDTETLHEHVIDVLKAGRTYSAFYRLALGYHARERLPLVKPPTLVCATAQDQLWRYIEEESQLVENGIALTLPASLEARADLFEGFLRSA